MNSKVYSKEFKDAAVKKYLSSTTSYPKLSESLGVSCSTLHKWVKEYGRVSPMKNPKTKNPDKWSPEKKLEAIIKTAAMNDDDFGEYLRSNGLHSDDLERFKNSFIESQNSKGRPKLDPELVALRKENKTLDKSLRRNQKALAEQSARIILLKKSHEIWGTDEDDE